MKAGERYCKATSCSRNENVVNILRVTDKCVFFNVNGGGNRRLPKQQAERLVKNGQWVIVSN